MNYIHNYVIVGDAGYYMVGYYDIIKLDNVQYFSTIYGNIKSKFNRLIFRITFSGKINKIIKNPFSSYIFPRLFPFKFNIEKPLVFIFFGNTQYIYQSNYISYLRKKYPNIKIVLYMQDIIARNYALNFDIARKKFDSILSYDNGDCKKYGLIYYPTPYSNYPIIENKKIEPIDIFYCGHAKMRYKEIFEVYRKCKNLGLKCKFFITAVPRNERIQSDDIIYDKPISYIENLQYVQKSKCILEIMQANADGYTPRLWESIVYNKHLLTNNVSLLKSKYYITESMHQLTDIENILSWINISIKNSFRVKSELSPINLLNFIDKTI